MTPSKEFRLFTKPSSLFSACLTKIKDFALQQYRDMRAEKGKEFNPYPQSVFMKRKYFPAVF
jgi:hypothetical protein